MIPSRMARLRMAKTMLRIYTLASVDWVHFKVNWCCSGLAPNADDADFVLSCCLSVSAQIKSRVLAVIITNIHTKEHTQIREYLALDFTEWKENIYRKFEISADG